MFNGKSCIVNQCSITFYDGNDFDLVFFLQKFGSMVTNVTQTLNDSSFTLKTSGQPGCLDIGRMSEKFTQGIHDPPPGGFGPATDTTMMHRFSGNTALVIDVFGMQVFVSIHD